MNAPINKSFLVLLLAACFFVSANAQRDRGSNREPRGNSYSNRECGNNGNRGNVDFNRQRNVDRAPDFNRGNNNTVFNRGNNNNGSFDRRSNDTRIADRDPINSNNSTFRRNNIPNVNNDRNTARNTVLGTQRSADLNPRRFNDHPVIVNNNVRF